MTAHYLLGSLNAPAFTLQHGGTQEAVLSQRAEYSIITNNTFPRTDFRTDTDFSFFRDVAKFTSEEVESNIQSAIDFYASRFGLDFSSQPKRVRYSPLSECHFHTPPSFL